jgi:hypothetical protein
VIAGIGVQALLALAILLKKYWRIYPAFSAYLLFGLFESVVLYPLYLENWQTAYFYTFWICEAVGIFLGLSVVREIFVNMFQAYPALRRMATIVFRVSVAALVVFGGFLVNVQSVDAGGLAKGISLANEVARLIELGSIVFLFLCASVFGLHWRQNVFGVALGLGMLVAFELADNTLVWHVSKTAVHALNLAKGIAYLTSLFIWLGYLIVPERLTSRADVPGQEQLEQWNQAVAELISQ